MSKKELLLILFIAFIVLNYFYLDGYELIAKVAHGETIEQAINYYHKNFFDFHLKRKIHTVDLDNNKKIIFYKGKNNCLRIALIKKYWNLRWVVLKSGGDVPFDYKQTPFWKYSKYKPDMYVGYTGLKDKEVNILVYYGVIYNGDVEKITIDEEYAHVIREENSKIWYKILESPNLEIPQMKVFGN